MEKDNVLNSVDIMMEEHQNILKMVRVVRNMCYGLYEGKAFDEQDFYDVIDFIKNYADRHHHGKEEEIMFQSMVDHLGRAGENLITHGMLVEHDLGRRYMLDLQEAIDKYKSGNKESMIDIIACAVSYTHLIERHIKKEDELIYPYGSNNLSKEVMHEVNTKTLQFEQVAEQEGVQEYYKQLLHRLYTKYDR